IIQHVQPEALPFVLGRHHLSAPEGWSWFARPSRQGAHHHHLFVLQDVMQQIVVASSTPSDITGAHLAQ
ncbi:MAG: hypothetical protein ACK56I_11980, partial [bacterium]